jgi:hypothetical protein
MAITLELAPETERQLHQLAAERGVPMTDYAQALLEKALLRERNAATRAVLQSFMEEDGDEQQETWRILEQGLRESRQMTRR